jgi:hypothetical protein
MLNIKAKKKEAIRMNFSNYLSIISILSLVISAKEVYEIDNVATVNGCGPDKFTINHGLKTVGESGLIECCNNHDTCYSKCSGKKLCDDEFDDCLSASCRKLPFLRRQLCYLDKNGMVTAVRLFGGKFYCKKHVD